MTGMGPISVVSAGAGTGKTYRLGTEYLSAAKAGMSPARIIATTFTVKAADELIERVRARLITEGEPQAAQLALAGLVGTVNSVCGRLIAEFAIDAGLSPVADVIPPEMADTLFSVAAEEAISGHADIIEPIAERLCQEDWRTHVQSIVNLARSNRIEAHDLASSATRSWTGLEPLLAPVESMSAEHMDRTLATTLQAAIKAIEASGDLSATTTKTMDEVLRPAARRLSSDRLLGWDDWARISKIKVVKATEAIVAPLKEMAGRHPSHPRLRSDIETFIREIFACAADALDHLSDYKRERGLLDFADQEALALDLLGRTDIQERIRERFDVLMVDEFQDTSPVQLAVFLELAKTMKRSLWVGDQKQAIFGFRETDPALVNAVIADVRPATGGTEEFLDESRRSRPSLVRFANTVFGAAFPSKGIAADKVVIPKTHRDEPDGFGPAINHWVLGGRNWSAALLGLAGRIAALLAAPDATPVIDRTTGQSRPLRGSDIAVLCRSNLRCKEVANLLGSLGIASAMPRDGLMETPEAAMAVAALRYLVDSDDTLAVAELLHLDGEADWLSRWLSDGPDVVKAGCTAVKALDKERAGLSHITPAEALDVAIGAACIDQHVRGWDRPGERLANLDALRKIAAAYESARRAERGAATAAGLVAHLAQKLENGGERPAFEGNDAVRILTYHRSKGLEWPMVILADLQDGAKRSPFGVYSEAPDQGFDPWRPLAGRWVRFWPWPYGAQGKNVYLDQTASASPEAAARTEAEEAELVRLLYVGVTRARDYLVFANYAKNGAAWLDLLTDAEGHTVLNLPADSALSEMAIAGTIFPIQVEVVGEPIVPAVSGERSEIAWFAPKPFEGDPAEFPPAWQSPSAAAGSESLLSAEPVPSSIGERMPLTGRPDMTMLGEAIHAFLAADIPQRPRQDRQEQGASILRNWGVSGVVTTDSLVAAADNLHRFATNHWPGAKHHREVPIMGRVGDQRISGRIDLLVETDDGFVIIDHKSFPGSADRWPQKAMEYAPQLALYGRLVQQATGKPVKECLVHMPVAGIMLTGLQFLAADPFTVST
ncbi:exodeoxyribonuclease V subunit beta [Magnetospirillum sp. SS-4]|uniref:UvrD-helicase domain-containing protein n=1 Tax=Magnetospirillum sp. SS-4 TaxID=2681465 RepID=UPI00137E35F0|nr:UvrD-helicase domain-containing protein [Magnetospirillum sp. SS-4]CAA7618449.1 UvrD/REP helicase [Magnetospirillum sp. SS-4]